MIFRSRRIPLSEVITYILALSTCQSKMYDKQIFFRTNPRRLKVIDVRTGSVNGQNSSRKVCFPHRRTRRTKAENNIHKIENTIVRYLCTSDTFRYLARGLIAVSIMYLFVGAFIGGVFQFPCPRIHSKGFLLFIFLLNLWNTCYFNKNLLCREFSFVPKATMPAFR